MSTATLNGAPPTTTTNPFAGKATKAGGNYELCPAGNHPAHLVLIHDLGTHDGEYKGVAKESRKLFFAWEVSGEIKPDGSPHVIGKEYTVLVEDDGSFLFAADSNLRKMMEAWRGSKYQPGEPIDPMKLLGRACLVNVSHTQSGEKTYANLAGVSALPKGLAAPARITEPVAYHISMGEPPDLDWLPWSYGQPLTDIVAESKERTGKPIGLGKGKGKGAGTAKDTPYSEAVGSKPAGAAAPEDDDQPPF
jgi:hypothetical protein